jgi:hypothetical protein
MILGKIKKLLSISFALVFFLTFSFSTNVFSQSSSIYNPKISISPSNPKYGQDVTVSVSLISINIDSANILWQVNGVTKKQGTGEKTFSFKTDSTGKTSLVKVIITESDGTTYENSYEIAPSEVDLIIEPLSFVPPFYKGKSAFVPQGSAKIVAITNILSDGTKISNNNLIFKWKKNGMVLSDSSGRGKNTLIVNGSVPIKDINIELEVSNSTSKVVGSNSIILTPYNTKVALYENNALYGKLFNKELTGYINIGTQEEFLIAAYPMFFNITDETGDEITYKWSVGNKSTATDGDVNTLLLRQVGNVGNSSISLKVDGVSRIFQYGSSGFSLMFGE